MLWLRYCISLLISSGDTTRFCTNVPAPVPKAPTIIIITGTSKIVLNFFLLIPIANVTAETKDKPISIRYIQRVTFTSVKPAPYTAPTLEYSSPYCLRKKLTASIMKKIAPKTINSFWAIPRSCVKLESSNCFFACLG